MEGIEKIAFELISIAGTAKSYFMDALSEAKQGNFQISKQLIKKGNKYFLAGHHRHTQVVQRESNGDKIAINLLLIHAEDQLMSVETVKILSEELIELYEKISKR
ncbi:MAG: PTS lactose/cellobiose transporter subunit IIA [Sporolactobacillus sp.]|jgi:PTS system cellobiose-specific IIA component|nr:PTS lactose/cellobiose transporter subunit IIA [Sporolactobacillus sp.]